MRLYSLVQLGEVILFFAVLVYALLPTPDIHPSLAVVAGGLLMGKAVLNILAPEGGTLIRRTLIGYGFAAVFVAVGITLVLLIQG
jgi:hypothetical protein